MTQNKIRLVKNSWAMVAQLENYNRLFEIMPEVKPMFSKTPLPEQSKKLLTMLSYVIAKLDKLEDIMSEITKLAQRHAGYGVTEEHYNAVGSALLWTLEQGLGAEWNEELETAWTDVYTVLAGAMLAGEQEEISA